MLSVLTNTHTQTHTTTTTTTTNKGTQETSVALGVYSLVCGDGMDVCISLDSSNCTRKHAIIYISIIPQ